MYVYVNTERVYNFAIGLLKFSQSCKSCYDGILCKETDFFENVHGSSIDDRASMYVNSQCQSGGYVHKPLSRVTFVF